MDTVVVAGDGAAADVYAGAHRAVADVGEVRHLGALADDRVLDFHVRAHVRALEDVGAAAQVRARAAGDVALDGDVCAHGLLERDVVGDGAVGETRVGADLALLAHARLAPEHRHGEQDRVAPDGDVGAHPDRARVEHRDALVHQALVDALLREARELGELGAVVGAEALSIVLAVNDRGGVAVAAQNLHHVGEVVLVLGIVVADLADMGGEKGAVKGVAAGVALGERRGLLIRAVLLLDDARDRAILGELDAAVAKRVGRRHREDGGGVRPARDGVGKGADGLGLDEGKVAVQDDNGPSVDSGPLQRHAHGVPGAQALRLLDALDVLLVCEMSPHLVGAMPHDHDDALGPGLARGARDPGDERAVEKLVHDLGVAGLHTRSLASGEDDRGHGHVRPPSDA